MQRQSASNDQQCSRHDPRRFHIIVLSPIGSSFVFEANAAI
ncbi:hypothetical protein SAMCFNEI73_pC1817 (plasmid) [Sinorhizobium americanum]|uniref:Uncharacterized protein n=1 Tax=Sinorhizobium americanum TaxID=194963 RepID=A0A1L3LZH8_9HYPH|nr:hypothetical protein SAMCFNEI73_pC1817 [Sinorhizobium americanum]